MRVFGVFSFVFAWNCLSATEASSPINIGVLHSSHSAWLEVIENYGQAHGPPLIETVVVNETDWCSLGNLESAIDMVRSFKLVSFVGHYNKVLAAVSDYMRIPYFITSLVPERQEMTPYHIRMLPDLATYTSAVRDLIQHYKWNQIGVLYDTEEGSNIAARLMQHLQGHKDLYDIRAYNIRGNSSADVVRWALKDLREKLITNYLVICSPTTADTVLTQALYLSLLSRPYSWLVVNLESGDIDLEKFIDSKANLTLLRLMVDPSPPVCALNESDISLTRALYFDVFHMINGTDGSSDQDSKKVSRADLRKWLKSVDVHGCTGPLAFGRDGKRNETFLQMLALQGLVSGAEELNQTQYSLRLSLLEKSGAWRSGQESFQKRLSPSRTYSNILNDKDDIFGDHVLRVTTKIEPPFVQWKNKTPDVILYGNDRFEGFCMDILNEISRHLNFEYNISLVPDGKFGSKKSWGWTGMINVLIQGDADIALAPFGITPDRSEVVDFTKPFMTKGTSVVVRKPERSVWPFQFLSPLSRVVWIGIFVSFLFVGCFLFGVSRINCDRKPNPISNLKESFWYVWGTLLRADLSGSPTATSGRIISCTWWFFSLIIISIYTANLAAFLTISNSHIPINSAADLADQEEYDYGTVDGTQIDSFFNNTRIEHYQKMRLHMSVFSPGSKVRRVEYGFDRVLKEKYAFIWDSPTVRHATANNCDLMEIGTPFDLKGYGIATQRGSKYSEPLSLAVLALKDEDVLYRLEGKWWRRPNCPDPRSSAKSKAIEIEVASGMFYVLLAGLLLSALVCVAQMLIRKHCKRWMPSSESAAQEDAQTNHNHVTNTLEVDETSVVLARTLSISDNCANSKWEL